MASIRNDIRPAAYAIYGKRSVSPRMPLQLICAALRTDVHGTTSSASRG
jgi:hypothetical protein